MLLDRNNRYNLANLITFGNIGCGLVAMHLIVNNNFFMAIVFAWIAGGLDIADGKSCPQIWTVNRVWCAN